MKNLNLLIDEVDKLFKHKNNPSGPWTFDYSLGKFPQGWQFSVVNSWHKWSAKKLKHVFGVWTTPEAAIAEFLDYVRDNKINVAKLMDD